MPKSTIAVNQNQNGFLSLWKVQPRLLIRPVAQALNKDHATISANRKLNNGMICWFIGSRQAAAFHG